jgi:hypothetical protein
MLSLAQSPLLRVQPYNPWRVSSETHNELPVRFIGFHHSMCLPNVFKAEHSGWLHLIAACRHLFGDGLKRNVRERKLRCAEHKAAEESQIDAACHLQERVEVGDRSETAQPAGQAGATTPAEHPEGIENSAVAHEVKHCIDMLCFSDAFERSGPSSSTRCAPRSSSFLNRSRLRVVAMTFAPASTAILSAASPKDEVAPRITSICPFVSSRLRKRQVQAVAYDSGSAASASHGRSDSICATPVASARVYSA